MNILNSIEQLDVYLTNNNCDFEIIQHDEPIYSTIDAKKYFDINKAAPTFILQTENGLTAFIVSSGYGRIDFNLLKQQLKFLKLKMADKDTVHEAIGYNVGEIPLIGHNLQCIFDKSLLNFDYIYGGTGNKYYTLKISPCDVMRLNNVIKTIE